MTINYRVGIFGFLNFFDEENGWTEGGNYGLLDQAGVLIECGTVFHYEPVISRYYEPGISRYFPLKPNLANGNQIYS